ncbi:hypothetical protein [Pseudomonas brassicacearum]|uniref:hypothetical protein n=1 Tax=Pseudomonas brassicacearum TaxID=930166 RepID=UPI003D6547B8
MAPCMTPCQQEIYNLVSDQLKLPEPTIIILNAEPGSGLSTLMEKITNTIGVACIPLTSRPAISGRNLLEAFYYHLGLGAEGISYRAPVPAFISPLIELQPIVGVLIEDIDDFAVTMPMRKMAIGHLCKIASALPGMSLIISQTLSRWDRDHSIRHNDIDGAQTRYEFYLRSFSGLSQFIDHFQCITASLGLHDVSNLQLTQLYEITGGNLASTMQHLCHPLLKHKWK